MAPAEQGKEIGDPGSSGGRPGEMERGVPVAARKEKAPAEQGTKQKEGSCCRQERKGTCGAGREKMILARLEVGHEKKPASPERKSY